MRSLVPLSLAVTLGTMAVAYAASPAAPSNEAPFLAENQAAMDKMMQGMKIKPSGDVDRDFAAMMIPHHQGAVDMAQAELRHGRNDKLRRIARQIIAEQPHEIVAMRQALGQPVPPAAASRNQSADLSGSSQRAAPMPMMNTQKRP
jgi:uncharacterized protein (DUF305 family)